MRSETVAKHCTNCC